MALHSSATFVLRSPLSCIFLGRTLSPILSLSSPGCCLFRLWVVRFVHCHWARTTPFFRVHNVHWWLFASAILWLFCSSIVASINYVLFYSHVVLVQMGYFMIGLAPVASVYFTHILITFILACILVSFGNTVAAAMPSFDVAQVQLTCSICAIASCFLLSIFQSKFLCTLNSALIVL